MELIGVFNPRYAIRVNQRNMPAPRETVDKILLMVAMGACLTGKNGARSVELRIPRGSPTAHDAAYPRRQ